MDFQNELRRRARQSPRTIILPETEDKRILKGAALALREHTARIVLLGEREKIEKKADEEGIDLTGALIRDIGEDPDREKFAEKLVELRSHRGMTLSEAREKVAVPLWFGALAVYFGQADGMVAGASTSSADVFHAALQVIGPTPGTEVVSVAGFMEIPRCTLGEEGLFLFADCVVVENPTAPQMASIALSAARTWETLVGTPPRIALISYSTRGSARSPMTEKVREATRLIREKSPTLTADGELQFDAAVVPEVARIKAPDSPVQGRANILIFPDLTSANSNFKNAERLGGGFFRASVVQGLARPVNDLSRGTTAETVADTIAVTVLQAAAHDA